MQCDTDGFIEAIKSMHSRMTARRLHPELDSHIAELPDDHPDKIRMRMGENLVCRVHNKIRVTQEDTLTLPVNGRREDLFPYNKLFWQTVAYQGRIESGKLILDHEGTRIFEGKPSDLAESLRDTEYALVEDADSLMAQAWMYLLQFRQDAGHQHIHDDLRTEKTHGKPGYQSGKIQLCLNKSRAPHITTALRMIGEEALQVGLGDGYQANLDKACAASEMDPAILIGFERTFEASLPKHKFLCIYAPLGLVTLADHTYLATQLECKREQLDALVEARFIPHSELLGQKHLLYD